MILSFTLLVCSATSPTFFHYSCCILVFIFYFPQLKVNYLSISLGFFQGFLSFFHFIQISSLLILFNFVSVKLGETFIYPSLEVMSLYETHLYSLHVSSDFRGRA